MMIVMRITLPDKWWMHSNGEMVQELYDGNYGASSSHHGGFVKGKRGSIDGERVLDIKTHERLHQ